jgi:RsiW-degrading membrane proteinase PrsW (M82 family)
VNPDQVLFRAITDGFTHALWASIAGFFIGLAVLHRRWAVQFILLGLAIPILFHAANDFFLGHNSPWVTAGLVGVAALMTVGYAISGNQIDRIIGQIESASARLPSASRSRYQQSPR